MLACNLVNLLVNEGREQSWLAKEIGVTKQQMSEWCYQESLPSIKYVYKIHEITGWTLTDMFHEVNASIEIPSELKDDQFHSFLEDVIQLNLLSAQYLGIDSSKEFNLCQGFEAIYNFFELKGKVEFETMVEDLEQLSFGKISEEEFFIRMNTYKEKGFVQYGVSPHTHQANNPND